MRALSTKSSVRTTTVPMPRSAGRPNTTTFCGTPKTPIATVSTSTKWIESPYMDGYMVAYYRQPDGKEKTGYPTQKPLGILSRIVRVHSRPGDKLLDFFAGSGSFGKPEPTTGEM